MPKRSDRLLISNELGLIIHSFARLRGTICFSLKHFIVNGHFPFLYGSNKSIIFPKVESFICSGEIKSSISSFKKIKNLKGCSLVSVQISTGRTHQIRIHAASINHPVIFDDKYGDISFNNKIGKKLNKNIALHSQQIEFKDQYSKSISVRCANPNHIDIFIEILSC